MGYVKYNEDDKKISEQRLYQKGVLRVERRVLPPVYPCRYCGQVFATRELLNAHIRDDHSIIRPVVVLNDRIAAEENYISHINSIVVYHYGIDRTMYVNNESVVFDINEESIDLTDLVSDVLNRHTTCEVSIGDDKYFFTLLTSQLISNPCIDTIIDDWDYKAANGENIVKNYPENLNEAEKTYLDGFFNYYVATLTDRYKEERYNDAFAFLMKFSPSTGRSKAVLKTIAFKRNWLHTLAELCDDFDDFSIAYHVMLNNQISENVNCDEEDQAGQIQKRFYIEDALHDNLNAFVAYGNGNLDDVQKYLHARQGPCIDSNLEDRIFLLRVKMAQRERETELAKFYSESIKNPYLQNNALQDECIWREQP